MNLFVAVGMDQDSILCVVCTPQRLVDHVVVMPPCYVRDRLVADRADTALLFPEVHQPTFPTQGLFHPYAESRFQVEFPCRIVGITCP